MEGLKEWGKVVGAKCSCLLANRNTSKNISRFAWTLVECMKKIIIFTAAYGNGHNSVAQVLKEQIKEMGENFKVEILDFFHVFAKEKETMMYQGYEELIRTLPGLFNLYYNAKDRVNFIKWFDTADVSIRRHVEAFFEKVTVDLVISTFPVASGYLAHLKKKGKAKFQLATVITDFVATSEWLYQGTDYYFVATNEIKKEMIQKGIEKDSVFVAGIPVRKEFYEYSEEEKIPGLVTFLGGGLGILPENPEFYLDISKIKGTNLVIVTGKNKELRKRLEETIKKENITILGFENNMPKLLRQSQVVVGKPGGLSLFEAVMADTPYILYQAKLGQEKRNERYFVKHRLGQAAKNEKECKEAILKQFTNSKERKIEAIQRRNIREAVEPESIKMLLRDKKSGFGS